MTYFYIITDNNDGSKSVYSINADSLQNSNELFIKKFFPLLKDVETINFPCLQDICKYLDYHLEVINPTEAVLLN